MRLPRAAGAGPQRLLLLLCAAASAQPPPSAPAPTPPAGTAPAEAPSGGPPAAASGGAAPGATAPGGTAPGGTAPGGTAPGGTAPGGTAPATATATGGAATPPGTAPQGGTAGSPTAPGSGGAPGQGAAAPSGFLDGAEVKRLMEGLVGTSVGGVNLRKVSTTPGTRDGVKTRCTFEGEHNALPAGWADTLRSAAADQLGVDLSRITQPVHFPGNDAGTIEATFSVQCANGERCLVEHSGAAICSNNRCDAADGGSPGGPTPSGASISADAPAVSRYTPAPRPPPAPRPETGIEWKIGKAEVKAGLQDRPGVLCIDHKSDTGCMSTDTDNPWLLLALPGSVPIGQVSIENPPSGCGQRLVCGAECADLTCDPNPGVEIRVGDQPCADPACSAIPAANKVASFGRETDTHDMRWAHIPVDSGTRGRYVLILLPGYHRRIDIRDVEIRAPEGVDYTSVQSTYGQDAMSTMEHQYQEDQQSVDRGNTKKLNAPTQSSTDDTTYILLVVIGVSAAITLIVGGVVWWRHKNVEVLLMRLALFAQGLLRLYDWFTDVLFFLYVSAISDLSEVNHYSVPALVILIVNFALECCRVGFAVQGATGQDPEPFFWDGATYVVVLQIPAALKVDISSLLPHSHEMQLRDRFDWATHGVEDVPQIVLVGIYMINRDVSLTSIVSMSVSIGALLASSGLKMRRKWKRDRKIEQVLRRLERHKEASALPAAEEPSGLAPPGVRGAE